MEKVLFVVNWDWVFFNFRLALARKLQERNYEVAIVCPNGEYIDRIQAEGIRWIDWPLSRRSLNPFTELRSVKRLAQIYRDEQPTLIHHDTIKPNMYGAFATLLNDRKTVGASNLQVVNTFMGLGYMFSSHNKARLLRRLLLPVFRVLLRQNRLFTVFSNKKDLDTFVELSLTQPSKAQLLVSECVNIDQFCPAVDIENSESRPFRVLMAARLLWDKGVEEFVEAARLLKKKHPDIEFWLAGLPDKQNPQWVPEETLTAWEKENLIRWLGHRSNMPELLNQVDIATLPTHYNEGLPRFLVEAAASGLPLIATDIPACRAIARDGVNGIIIPKRSHTALAEAIAEIFERDDLRNRMRRASRAIAVEEFNEQEVLEDWIDLYRQLSRQAIISQ